MKLALLLVLGICCRNLWAQDDLEKLIQRDKSVEQLLSTMESDQDNTERYETLVQQFSQTMDVNTVTPDQLRTLMILSEGEIKSFLDYRNNYGPLLSLHELQSVPGWDSATLGRMLPFLAVRDRSKVNGSLLRQIAHEENNYLVIRHERTLESKKGYQPGFDSTQRYAGSPDKFYIRYQVSRPGNFSIGFTAEKDPGEPLVWNPSLWQPGFDFFSWHVQLLNKGRLQNLLVGDFQCQFGQGLQLGTAFGMGKNSETITGIRRSSLGFLPYTSAGETLFLRGLAASWKFSALFTGHIFVSHKKRDGKIDGPTGEDPIISSLSSSGLHRTIPEIENQKQAGDTDVGLVLQFRNDRIDAGVITHYKEFSEAIFPRRYPYNQFALQGRRHLNTGIFFNMSWANATFFSEVAHTVGYGTGITAGVLASVTHKVEMAWQYRNFSNNYYAHYANAFSEGTNPQNEEGFYWGGKYSFSRQFSWSGYVDLFRFPWLRYRVYRPSDGMEWLLRFAYSPSRSVSFFIQAREETKVRNAGGENSLYTTDTGVKRNLWINCEYAASPNLTIKSRLQGSQYTLGTTTSQGLAFIQDISFSRPRWTISIRYALFDTDDYENRQYVYEKDVWLTASLPAYDGIGARNCVLIQFQISRKTDLWVRWARTKYLDRTEIGSGGEQIDGNSRNDAKFQVRIRF